MAAFSSYILLKTPDDNASKLKILYSDDGVNYSELTMISDLTNKYYNTNFVVGRMYKIQEMDVNNNILKEYIPIKYDVNDEVIEELKLFLGDDNLVENNPTIVARVYQYQNYVSKRTGKSPLPKKINEEYISGRYTYDWDGYLFQTRNYPVIEFYKIELFVMSGWKDLYEYLGEPGREKLWWKDEREGVIFIKFVGLNGYALWLPAPGRWQIRVTYLAESTFSESLWRAVFLLVLTDIYRNSDNFQFTTIGEKILVNFGERIAQYQQEIEQLLKSEIEFKIIDVWN